MHSEKLNIYSWISERVNDVRLRSFFESDKPEFKGLNADEVYKKLLLSEIYEPLGKLIVYPERMTDWINFASGNGSSIVADFLVLISAYSKNLPIDEIKTLVDDHHGFISNAVLYFYKKGPEFFKEYDPTYINNPDTVSFIERVEKENESFKNHDAYVMPKSMQ